MQVGVGRGTDSRRITQAYVLALHGEVEFDLAIVGTGVSAEGEQPTAGALAREPEFFNPEKLAGQAETHWTIIVNLDVFYVGVKIAQISDNVQLARPSKRPL